MRSQRYSTAPNKRSRLSELFAHEETNKSVISGPITVALVEHLRLLNKNIASKEVEASTINSTSWSK